MKLNTQNAEFVLSAARLADCPRDSLPQIAFAGRSNVGKSSVINRLLNRKNFARVGSAPGKTTHINYFRIDRKVYFVDLPGYGYAKVSKQERARWGRLIEQWFADASLLTLGILLVDLRHKPTADDCVMAQWFKDSGKPFVVVANKQDKIKKSEWEPNLARIRETLALDAQTPVISFSAEKGLGKRTTGGYSGPHQRRHSPGVRKRAPARRPEGEEMDMKRVGGLFLYAILAGFCIGLGGTVFLKLKDAFPGGNVVGALLFTIGLFTVCTRGYALFTGKACYLFDNPLPAYLLDLLVFWVGNLLGAMLIAGLEHLTGMVGGETGIDATAAALVEGKMGATYLGLFVLGILCNICIFIAVNGYANNPHQVGKYLALFLGVSVFILCGTEHSVADMYYWSVSGVLYAQPGESVLRLLIISLGNVVGGVFFPLMEKGKRRLDLPEAP